jgi:hypothetical protein
LIIIIIVGAGNRQSERDKNNLVVAQRGAYDEEKLPCFFRHVTVRFLASLLRINKLPVEKRRRRILLLDRFISPTALYIYQRERDRFHPFLLLVGKKGNSINR